MTKVTCPLEQVFRGDPSDWRPVAGVEYHKAGCRGAPTLANQMCEHAGWLREACGVDSGAIWSDEPPNVGVSVALSWPTHAVVCLNCHALASMILDYFNYKTARVCV